MISCVWNRFIDLNCYQSISVTNDLCRLITVAVSLRLPSIDVNAKVELVDMSRKIIQPKWKRMRDGSEHFELKMEVLTPLKARLHFKYLG